MEREATITQEMAALLRILSKPGAMEILALAGPGIARSTDAMKGLGLSPKQYYSRLKELTDAGLVDGGGGAYRQTALGRIVHGRVLTILGRACEGREELGLLNHLEAANVDVDVRGKVVEALEARGIVGLIESEGDFSPVKVINDYNSLVDEATECIDRAEEVVLLATQYIDMSVSRACYMAVRRGVDARFLIGRRDRMMEAFNMLRGMITDPRTTAHLLKLFVSSELKVRYVEIPYTFIVIDRSMVIIELPNPLRKNFSLALLFRSASLSELMIGLFNDLWAKGSELKREVEP